jgi:hypothetical protein
MVFAKYSIFQRPSMLGFFVGSITGVTGIFALITFLFGLWARWSLSPFDAPNLAAGVRTILRKWVVGALVLGVLMILSDVIFQWRGQRFAVGGTPDAIAENIGQVGGVAIACVAIGLITGYVSRRGLKKAIADDTLRSKPNIPVQAENQSQIARDISATPPKNFIIRQWRGGLSLPVSYWVVGFLGNIFIAIIVLLLAEVVSPTF